VGEKTPTYSYQPESPERIASLLPQVKLIWIFRHPVARLVSHYWFFVSTGKERLSLAKALAREDAGKTSDYTMRYRDRSIYVKQVERYQQFFALDQMLFLLFEEYLQNPAGEKKRDPHPTQPVAAMGHLSHLPPAEHPHLPPPAPVESSPGHRLSTARPADRPRVSGLFRAT